MLAGRPVAIALGDGAIAERDREAALKLPLQRVVAMNVAVDDEVHKNIDDELRRKYANATNLRSTRC